MMFYKGYNLIEYVGGGWCACWGYSVEFEAATLGAVKCKITKYLNGIDNG